MSKSDIIERRTREQELRARLLQRIAAGESLARITGERAMPPRWRVYKWIWTEPAFAAAYHEARAGGVPALADQCLEIADTPATTAVEVSDKRLRIDTRMRLMAKWRPAVHGDEAGAHGGPVRAERRLDVSKLTDEQLAVLASIPIE